MKSRTILSALILLGAVAAHADHNWNITSTYTYAVIQDVGSAFIRDLEFKDKGDFTDPNQGGWGTSTSYYNNSQGGDSNNANTITTSFDTYPWYGVASSKPVKTGAIFFGIMQGLPQDIADNNPDQKHLVLFMDSAAAANVENIVFGTVFPNTNEDALINALEYVHSDDHTDAEKQSYYQNYIYPFWDAAESAHAGPSGTESSIYIQPNSAFSIVLFSNGQIVGSGTSVDVTTQQPVPEPASMAALGLGVAAVLRRRRR